MEKKKGRFSRKIEMYVKGSKGHTGSLIKIKREEKTGEQERKG